MTISSSIFEGNQAQNGGAIYFNKIETNENRKNSSISIVDTIFRNNVAKYFGGAMYSDFEGLNGAHINNVNFTSNKAYSGGAVYTSYNKNKTLFDVFNKNINYTNNFSESHGNDYASDPYMIYLKDDDNKNITLKSGNIFPLEFNITDQFDQYVNDISKYYPNIGINVNIDNINSNCSIFRNTCYFSKGINFYSYLNIIIIYIKKNNT